MFCLPRAELPQKYAEAFTLRDYAAFTGATKAVRMFQLADEQLRRQGLQWWLHAKRVLLFLLSEVDSFSSLLTVQWFRLLVFLPLGFSSDYAEMSSFPILAPQRVHYDR